MGTPSEAKELSIVVPVYNEQDNVSPLCMQLTGVLESMLISYEVILVDDGSKDRTWSAIRSVHDQNNHIRAVSLSRNFGHQVALLAGLQHARGKLVITMDGDLQHPPELIPKLYEKHLEGYDVVNTTRIDAASTGFFKKWSSRLFYRLLNTLAEVQISPGSADFRLMTRQALNAYLSLPERDRFTRGLISWIGFRQTSIPYRAGDRASGKSKYSLRKMITFGLSGITSFSSRPLRFSFYSGVIFSILGFVYAVYALIGYINGQTIPGWTSILLSLLVIGGITLVNLGIIGEYIARIFHEVKARPAYFIQEELDGEGDQQKRKHE